jgi:hypothetical protein
LGAGFSARGAAGAGALPSAAAGERSASVSRARSLSVPLMREGAGLGGLRRMVFKGIPGLVKPALSPNRAGDQ